MIYQINKIKYKNHIIILIDTQKVYVKAWHPLSKIFQHNGYSGIIIEAMYDIIKAMHEKSTTKTIFNSEETKNFLFDEEQDKDATLTSFVQQKFGNPNHSSKARKINKSYPN